MPSLTNLATLKTRISVSGTSLDGVLTGVLDASERAAVVYLGYDPSNAQAVEYYATAGTADLPLDRRPVTGVTSVHSDDGGYWGQGEDAFAADTALTEGTDYALKVNGATGAAVLHRINSVWPFTYGRPVGRLGSELVPAPGAVRVEYTAGYQPAQLADIREGVYQLATALWASRGTGTGPVQSSSLDGRSVSVGAGPQLTGRNPLLVSPLAELLLQPHRRRPLA